MKTNIGKSEAVKLASTFKAAGWRTMLSEDLNQTDFNHLIRDGEFNQIQEECSNVIFYYMGHGEISPTHDLHMIATDGKPVATLGSFVFRYLLRV